jgi:hypothetical protein
VVEEVSSAQVGGGLGNKFGPLHLRVPCGGGVDGHLETTLFRGVGRVLVLSAGVEISGSRLAAVDVLSGIMSATGSHSCQRVNSNVPIGSFQPGYPMTLFTQTYFSKSVSSRWAT